MVEYRLKIPDQLDRILAAPVLLYRLLRHGYTYRRIPLTQGQYAKVDVDNFYRFIKHKWQACLNKKRTYYARRTVQSGTSKKQIHMHRVVMQAQLDAIPYPLNANLLIDHKNGDTLDNRPANLRIATASQNCYNRICRGKTSKYKGVHYLRSENCYQVNASKNGKSLYVGRFKSELEAARAYDTAAKKYHKEFARLNFPCPERRRRARLNFPTKRIDWFRFIKRLRKLPPANKKQNFTRK